MTQSNGESNGESERSTDAQRWRLEDQRDFLVRSLADLRAERDAGDIGARDYEALAGRDEQRLAEVEAELARLEERRRGAPVARADTAAPPERTRRRRRGWLAVVAVVALSAGTTLLVIHLASPRLPGQPLTGSASQNLAQRIQTQLAQATVLVDLGTTTSLAEALALYKTVLTEDPNQPQALAETGYLEWEAGHAEGNIALQNRGRALVERSLKVLRNDFGAHLFLGTIDLEQGNDPAASVVQYRAFLAEHPPAAQVTQAAPLIRKAFSEAGQTLPAAVPAA
jgi:hypothetical protein